MERIVLEVDDATGKAYQKFSTKAKTEFNRVISIFLKKAINDADADNYKNFLDKIGREAEENGLTPEKLGELLRTDD
jgi:hypothetical protein